ncbi:MAG TPA: hypothetical protein VH352_05490, partial [Pseudonocardiaceae bacterium]|nr:hypothetical protein [Pseudonocardiaceae bacterium]
RGADWVARISQVLARNAVLRMHYRSVVATDSAIIALAEPTHLVLSLRRSLLDALCLPPGGPAMLDLVHTTIFRYGRQMRHPKKLLDLIENLDEDIDIEIDRYVVSHQQIYPHLCSETVASIRPRASPHPVPGEM